MICLVILIILFILAFGSGFFETHNPNATNPNLANLPPKIPGIDINGFNGTIEQSGTRVNAYVQAHAGNATIS